MVSKFAFEWVKLYHYDVVLRLATTLNAYEVGLELNLNLCGYPSSPHKLNPVGPIAWKRRVC